MSRGRKALRKYIVGLLAVVMAAVLLPVENVRATDENDSPSTEPPSGDTALPVGSISLESKNRIVPVYEAGVEKEWVLTVTNNTDYEINNVIVQPELGDTLEAWPFRTDQQNYKSEPINLGKKQTVDIVFKFIQRENIPTTRFTIPFSVTADGMEPQIQKLYVNTTEQTVSEPEPQPEDFGGISNGEAVYSGGGGGSDSTSVPRVIVTGFTTNPAEVRAGSDFTLTVHLKNTSKASRVQNMLFDLQAPTEGADEQTMAPAFLPSSGSSSIYLEGIDADGAADIAINLNAKSDLLQKPYSIDLSMKYEDGAGAQVEAASSISIPVKQDARFELSEFEISPESIAVGEEANIMCNLYNLGRIKLYNVKAVFEGACIEKEEVFLGNVDSGATASIDAMLEGKKATEGPAKVNMTLSYDDEAGKRSESKKEFQIMVTDVVEDNMMPMMEEMEEEGSFPMIPAAIVSVFVIVIAAIVFIVKRNKKKRMKNEEEALLDELDGPSEDEWQ